MKIQGKQDIEYWITKNKYGVIIRVYQVDQPDINISNKNPFTTPILIDYMGKGESLAEIIEERDSLKRKVEERGMYLSSYWLDKVENIEKILKIKANKKWWQFWK